MIRGMRRCVPLFFKSLQKTSYYQLTIIGNSSLYGCKTSQPNEKAIFSSSNKAIAMYYQYFYFNTNNEAKDDEPNNFQDFYLKLKPFEK